MLSVWAVCLSRPWARSKDSSVSLFAHPSPKQSPSRKSLCEDAAAGLMAVAGPDLNQAGRGSAADGC